MFVKCFIQTLPPPRKHDGDGRRRPLDLEDAVALGFPSSCQEGADVIPSTCLSFLYSLGEHVLFIFYLARKLM